MLKKFTFRRGIIWTLVIALVAMLAPSVFANTAPIKLVVNGHEIAADVPPQIIDGRTLVPVRFVSEALGATVSWNAEKRAVLINSDASQAGPQGNDIQLIVNGVSVATDVPPLVVDGRTLVPVRFVSEALGSQVHWDNSTRTVSIQAGTTSPSTPVVRDNNKIKVNDAHTIDRSKQSIEERYANSLRLSVQDLIDVIDYDEGITRNGNTFVNTLTTPGGTSNRSIRIGFKDGEGQFDFTALNGSSGEIGMHIVAGVDVSKTTNGMYLNLKNDVSEDSGYVSLRHLIDWREYDEDTAVFDSLIELGTTLWDVDNAFLEILLPWQAEITIDDIFLYIEREVPGFSDMHERIIGGAEATTDNMHVVHDAAEFAETLEKVREAQAPSIIYINGTIGYDDWIEATGDTDRMISVGSQVRDLSIIGVEERGVFDGLGLKIHGHNVILENLTFQHVISRNGVEVNNATDVWIRHSSFIDESRDLPTRVGFDELMSVKNHSQHVIISWNHFRDSNRVLLVGSNDGVDAMPDRRIIMHHNFIENVVQRVPLYRGGHGHFYNNYVKDVSLSGANVRSNAKLRLENNYFEDARDPIGDFHNLIPGRWEVSGNMYVNSTGSQPTESTITINFKDYHYELDPTEKVPEIVTEGAGVGKIEQDLEFIESLIRK